MSLLKRGGALAPQAADVAYDLAQALTGAGEWAAARDAYLRVIESDPRHYKAHYGLARVLVRLGEHEAARQAMTTYRRLYDAQQEQTRRATLERARLDRGWELMDRGDFAAALEVFSALAEGAEALAGRAQAHSGLGDHRSAVRHLERALSLAPQRRDLVLLLAEERLAAEKSR